MTADPSVDEIIAAVSDWLAAPVDPALDPYFRRVAANALGIVRRELTAGSDPAAPEVAALCDALRHGTIDENTPGLIARLKAAAVRQIAIDQPSYRSPPVTLDLSGGKNE